MEKKAIPGANLREVAQQPILPIQLTDVRFSFILGEAVLKQRQQAILKQNCSLHFCALTSSYWSEYAVHLNKPVTCRACKNAHDSVLTEQMGLTKYAILARCQMRTSTDGLPYSLDEFL